MSSKRFGKARAIGCACTHNFTCGACLNAAGPTRQNGSGVSTLNAATAHGSAFPHEGGCEGCRHEGRCNYCGVASIKYYHDRCTNGRCLICHRDHCTDGGATAPGHGYGV